MMGLRSAITSAFGRLPAGLGPRGRFPTSRRSPFSLLAAATVPKLPDGISLQVLDESHDLSQVKELLVRAFVVNNEPILQALGKIHYPSLSAAERAPLVEKRFSKLFSKESLAEKVKQGLSIVAVKDNDPNQVVSAVFGERYKRVIYNKADDPLCQNGINLMRAVHEKALPVLDGFDPNDIIFVSHAVTHPNFQSLGIFEHIAYMSVLFFGEKGVKIAYFIITANRFYRFVAARDDCKEIAEVFYDDYEDEGKRVFANLAQKEISAKALIQYL